MGNCPKVIRNLSVHTAYPYYCTNFIGLITAHYPKPSKLDKLDTFWSYGQRSFSISTIFAVNPQRKGFDYIAFSVLYWGHVHVWLLFLQSGTPRGEGLTSVTHLWWSPRARCLPSSLRLALLGELHGLRSVALIIEQRVKKSAYSSS